MSQQVAAPPSAATSSASSSKSRTKPKSPARNPELDAARGVALVLAVIVVTAPATAELPPWLGRSSWAGLGIGDLLPAVFATLAGVALALQVRRHAKRSWAWWVGRMGRRLLVLGAAGIALVWVTSTPGLPVDPDQLRWTDDLVRIGVASVVAVPLVRLPRWGEVAIATALLGFHHAVMLAGGLPLTPATHGLVGLDQRVLGAAHALGPVDPNGITALAPTLVTLLVGFWIGEWIEDRPRGAATGSVLLLLGAWAAVTAWSWQLVIPGIATIWTGPIVLAGIALALALLGLGHLATRLALTDRLVANASLGGRTTLPLWIVAVLVGRWLTATEAWGSLVVDGLGELLTVPGAVLVVGAVIAGSVMRLGTALVDRGWVLRA